MQPQIVHESEVHRQHVRLKIPIGVEIDGTRFTVDDWSLGGFGVESSVSSRQPGERFPVRMIFPFEDFEVSLRLDCQMVYILDDETRFGCRFLGLSKGQGSLFRYLVDAYISGELVSGGDVLALAGRDNTAEARAAVVDPKLRQDSGNRLRQFLGYCLLGALAIGLAAVIWSGVQERFFEVDVRAATITAPTVRLRAPSSGVLRELDAPELLRAGTPIGVIAAPNAEPQAVSSPCECIRLRWIVTPGQFVAQGEEVAVLVESDAPLRVQARVDYDDALRLEQGQRATIRLPGVAPEEAVVQGEVDAIDFASGFDEGVPDAERAARVTLRPDRPLPFDALGSLVTVEFE